MQWEIVGKPGRYRHLNAARAAAQASYARPLNWTDLRTDSGGRLFCVGRTGCESDDKVTIRRLATK
jgi:hypothetical protein